MDLERVTKVAGVVLCALELLGVGILKLYRNVRDRTRKQRTEKTPPPEPAPNACPEHSELRFPLGTSESLPRRQFRPRALRRASTPGYPTRTTDHTPSCTHVRPAMIPVSPELFGRPPSEWSRDAYEAVRSHCLGDDAYEAIFHQAVQERLTTARQERMQDLHSRATTGQVELTTRNEAPSCTAHSAPASAPT